MKVRHGHVSNSSTSSFFGIGILVEDIKEIKKEFLPTKEDDEYGDFFDEDGSLNLDSYEFWEWLVSYSQYSDHNSKASEALHEASMECENPFEDGEYRTLVASYTSMKLDETKQQFIDRVKKALNIVFEIDESDIGHVSEAWRNG